jgi:hypothetical protein
VKKIIWAIVIILVLITGFFVWSNIFNKQAQGNSLAKQDLIQVTLPNPGDKVSSPLTIRGQARGNWYFEASFGIIIKDSTGKELGVAVAQAQSDWTTTDFVPFTATLQFAKPTTKTGTLYFYKDNPSGLPQNADEMYFQVNF